MRESLAELFKHWLTWVFLGAFLFFCLLLTPMWILQMKLSELIEKQSQVRVHSHSLSLGTGLGLGIGRGGLWALRGRQTSIALPSGHVILCDRMSLSPQLWPLFLLQLRGALYCDMGDKGSLLGSFRMQRLPEPEKLQLQVNLNELSLRLLDDFLQGPRYYGDLKGELKVDFNLKAQQLENLSWDLVAQNLQTPNLNMMFLNLPSMRLGEIESKGTFRPGQIEIPSLKLGNESSPLQGELKVSFGLNPQGIPISGVLEGKLKTDAEFERNSLSDINLDLLFGQVKGSGFREFRKPLRGSVMSLMSPPE